ncbi:MAG: sensor histidine kinase [Acidobacteriaceae bacterium]|nr:sensor histidine kinase [Acidobacteriaceae bacterium]
MFRGYLLERFNETIIMVAESRSITESHFRRLLILGLGVSVLLLLSALFVASRTVHQMNTIAEAYARQQSVAKDAIDGIQAQQSVLNRRWLRLARSKDSLTRDEVLNQLAENQAQMSSTLEAAYQQAEMLRQNIYQQGQGLLEWMLWLFTACVALSLLFATWTVRASTTLFKTLERQSAELTSLQYQFLKTQEDVARRFSHELHDELGQALTAVKANLSAFRQDPDPVRVDDCMLLVDGAIRDVRQISQLLRPTILDDFGLDAALRALSETFSQRTGIAVHYRSELAGARLREDTETHFYRIAQEALTNVARHANATAVNMDLSRSDGRARLIIADNGRGLEQTARADARGLGLAGMEMRARGCGGRLTLQSAPGKGLKIEVACPTT